MQKLCVDLGYGYTKAIASNGEKVIIPSIVGPGYKRNMAALLGETNSINADNLHVRIKEESETSEFFVGNLARKESQTASYAFEENKINHPNTKALLSAVAGLMLDNNEETILVTGLPLEYFQTQKEEFEQFLKTFKAEVTLYGTNVEVTRNVSFDQVIVYPQAAGAIYDALTRNPSLTRMKDVLIGTIDIGHKTTDYIVFEVTNKMTFVQSLSGTINFGISVLHNHLDQAYYMSQNRHLKPMDAEKIIRNGGRKMVYDQELDFSKALASGIEELAKHLKAAILTKWDHRLEDFPRIFLAGGGAYILKDALGSIHPNVEMIENAQMANVNGYMRIANMQDKKHQKAG